MQPNESGREAGPAHTARVQDIQRRSAIQRGLRRRRADRRDLRQPHVHSLPLRLQQDRSDLDRGGEPDRQAAAQRRRQLQHEAQSGLLPGSALAVLGAAARLHEEARPAPGLLRRPDLAPRRHGRARLPRHPQDAGGRVQVRARLGNEHEVLAPTCRTEPCDAGRGRHSGRQKVVSI